MTSPQQTIRSAAQNFLTAIFRSVNAPSIGYDREGARMIEAEACVATNVLVNEEECNFVVDKNNGTERAVISNAWTMSLLVAWPREVDTREFVMQNFRKEIRVPATDAHASFRILVLRYAAKHPVRGEPAHGTTAQFFFQIEPPRGS